MNLILLFLASFVDEFQIDSYDLESNTRLTAFYIASWRANASDVGMAAYFLDNIFVCIGIKSNHFSDEVFEWVSQGTLNAVQEYVKSLVIVKENNYTYEFIDFEEDQSDSFTLCYRENLLNKSGFLRKTGEEVQIDARRDLELSVDEIHYIKENHPKTSTDSFVRVTLKSGETRIVALAEIKLSYNIIEPMEGFWCDS